MGPIECRKRLLRQIIDVNETSFTQVALDLFKFQANHNELYGRFLNLLRCEVDEVQDVTSIPFLPIEAFKHHEIKTGSWKEEVIFQSSGNVKSQHFTSSISFYHNHAAQIFEDRFGPLSGYEIFGLLPHYLKAGQSSLVSMVRAFMDRSGQETEHFYLDDFKGLVQAMNACAGDRVPILFGVTYALLDFASAHPGSLPSEALIFETGGMKGRKKEWRKSELHEFLKESLGINAVHSEYGMTELLSQAYAEDGAFFQPPRSMHIMFKELNDPTAEVMIRKAGVAHIIDLANIDTCSFIATSDLGVSHGPSGFEILGRVQDADLRGCQLMYI